MSDALAAFEASRHATVRLCIALGGIDRVCPRCGTPVGHPCPRDEQTPLYGSTREPDVVSPSYDGRPVVCEARARFGAERRPLCLAFLGCVTDADFAAVLLDFEPLRSTHFADADPGPVSARVVVDPDSERDDEDEPEDLDNDGR